MSKSILVILEVLGGYLGYFGYLRVFWYLHIQLIYDPTDLAENFVDLDPIIQNSELKEKKEQGFSKFHGKKVQRFINS